MKNPGYKKAIGRPSYHKGYEIRGWQSDSQRRDYRKFAANINDGIVVEVGVFGGTSILSIVDICIKNNNVIYGVDPWETTDIANGQRLQGKTLNELTTNLKSVRLQLEKVIDELEYSGHIKLVQDFSIKAAESFDDNSIDMIYIDGDHSYDAVTADIKAWLPKLKESGIMWGDDYCWQSVKDAVADFCKINGLKFSSNDRCWYLK